MITKFIKYYIIIFKNYKMIDSNDKNALTKFLETTQYKKREDLLSSTEYREAFNAERLYENMSK